MAKKTNKSKTKPKPRRKPAREVEASAPPASPPPAPIIEIPKAGSRSKYAPDMCERVLILGADGKSRSQIARDLGVHRDTIYEWMKVHPEFKAAMSHAADLALAWWEDQGQAGIWAGKAFNASAWTVQMLNRFPGDYKARPEAPAVKVDVNLTEVRNGIASKLDRVAKSKRA